MYDVQVKLKAIVSVKQQFFLLRTLYIKELLPHQAEY